MQYRELGRTGQKLSVIGFGAILVMSETQPEADRLVAKAIDRGVTYFDVAPSYGDAEERLGPALEPYRNGVFLACKTNKRDAAGAQEELDRSLSRFNTDHFDLYQFHGVSSMAEVDQIFGPGGAMEIFLRAREQGKVRFIGFSAHNQEAAVEMFRRFPFVSVLCPLNYASYIHGGFGPKIVEAARQSGAGMLALKGLCRTKMLEGTDKATFRWSKCWYQPFEDDAMAGLALRFTLCSLPVTAAVTPGHEELFDRALRVAQNPTPLSPEEERALRNMAMANEPLFSATPG